MNKKGFTLVELLAVITLIILLFVLVVPSVSNIISSGQDTVYQKQMDTILNSAYDWSLKNVKELPDRDKKIFITLALLKKYGLIDNNITDPKTKELFPNDLVISITNVGGNYKNSNKYSKLSGDFLYTIETNLSNNSTYEENKPTITINGLTKQSDGNYVVNADLNSEFIEYEYSATSSENVDITSNVIKNILLGNKTVSTISTKKAGVYYVYYTVVDDNGYANTIILNVIVSDLTPPVITLPSNNTITTSVKSFDLMDGVSCTDNSGECDITFSGSITFGSKGKYVIEYTAKDPSGNTKIAKRVITVQ